MLRAQVLGNAAGPARDHVAAVTTGELPSSKTIAVLAVTTTDVQPDLATIAGDEAATTVTTDAAAARETAAASLECHAVPTAVKNATVEPLVHDLDAVSVRLLEDAATTPAPAAPRLSIDTCLAVRSVTLAEIGSGMTVATANGTIAAIENEVIAETASVTLVDHAAVTTVVIGLAATGPGNTTAGTREMGPPETAEIREAQEILRSGGVGSRTLIAMYRVLLLTMVRKTPIASVNVKKGKKAGAGAEAETGTETETETGTETEIEIGGDAVGQGVEIVEIGERDAVK